jgi:Zn finger protein HypA/HybF involved in hydrogenase expression
MVKYPIICSIHGVFEVTLDNHTIKKTGCGKCRGLHKTYKDKINEANKIHNNKYDYSLIKDNFNNFKSITIICPEHGEFNQVWTNHTHSKQGCPKCAKYGRKSLSLEQLKDKINNLNTGYEYDWNSYKGYYDSSFKIKCNKHGWFNQQISNHLFGQKCPKCKSSKGELIIEKFLKENNIKYITQKKFDKCINPKTNYKLKFDFYLPDKNLCIEYDGQLHYKSVKYFGGDKELQNIIFKDNIKNKFCKDNNINLIRISYINFNNINTILKNI